MGVFHPHPRVRIRAQAIVRFSQGLTLQQTANEFHVHLNSIEAWRQRWNKQGLMGLYEGRHTGRKRKWTAEQQEALRASAQADGGSANSLLRTLAQKHTVPRIVVLDNTSFHKGPQIEKRRRKWMAQGLFLYYLPPYSPELNRIDILWKQAKYFWRRFAGLKGSELLSEVESLMKGFGNAFTINFV